MSIFTTNPLAQLMEVPDSETMYNVALHSHTGHDIAGFLICLGFLAVYDFCISRNTPGRWFHVHALANAITVIFAIPAMILWFKKPLDVGSAVKYPTPDPLAGDWLEPEILFHPCNDWCLLMVVAVHVYHCIAFDLSAQDIFHHMMFIPTLGVYGGFGVKWGPIRNCLAFFMSGLPGGVDYFNLVLQKRGLVDKLTVKRISSKLNVWIRGPGCGVLIPATIYASWTEQRLQNDQLIPSLILSMFASFNGLYYMDMAVKNYQMHLTRSVMQAKHSEELEMVNSYWMKKEAETIQIKSSSFSISRKGSVVGDIIGAASQIGNAIVGHSETQNQSHKKNK